MGERFLDSNAPLKLTSGIINLKIDDEEDNLLQGLNSYRQAQNLPPLTKNAKADCIANEIADDAEDQPCTVTTAKSNVVASRPSQITKYLNDSRFVGAGLGKEDDWMVVVLTTGANTGSFEGSGAGLVVVSIWGWVVLVVLGFLIGDFVRL
ncbi:uncharacterized GPI-anchored protein At3g06035-like [Benincasa hispida]|uniref:uncharacterized GPI-anchored protein At3g06035-like n=1 Tax=Benincasa hispida TaxID=102211 RepID=UPI001901C13A|nr:uncharacterized GPI-anchored protein At3g06035-like [Benincasa hispida]